MSSYTNTKILNLYGFHRYNKLIKDNTLCPGLLSGERLGNISLMDSLNNVPKDENLFLKASSSARDSSLCSLRH